MNQENQFNLIQDFDRLEALMAQDPKPGREVAGDLAGELDVLHLLAADAAQDAQMPRQQAFRNSIMQQVQPPPRKKWWMGPSMALAVAAALIAAFVIPMKNKDTLKPGVIEVAPDLLAQVETVETRESMVTFLEQAEMLLTSIREMDTSCSEEGTDLELEKNLVKSMLLRQKEFSGQIDGPRYFQARDLFAQLETILVDLNGLDSCADTMELEFLNEHISKNRILSKVRMVAQDIQLS